jgi:hypothetical protein
MKMYGGVEVQLHRSHFSTRAREVVRFTLWLLYLKEISP